MAREANRNNDVRTENEIREEGRRDETRRDNPRGHTTEVYEEINTKRRIRSRTEDRGREGDRDRRDERGRTLPEFRSADRADTPRRDA